MHINFAEEYHNQARKKSVFKKVMIIGGFSLVLQLSFLSLMPMTYQAIPAEATGVCNLIITKTVDKTTALPGDILEYAINYRNAGSVVCTGGGVQVFDTLNSNLTYLANSKTLVVTNDGEGDGSLSGIGDDYNGHGNDLLFNIKRVSPGESGVITLRATVGAFSCGDYQIPNKAKIWSNETNYLLSEQIVTNINLPCAYCGDGIKNNTEACDGSDGVGAHQACSQTCTLTDLPYCGDNMVNGSEQCDGLVGLGLHQSCAESCTLVNLPYCGDGIVNGSETCDDSNTVSGDGCSPTCQPEGGNNQTGSLKICKYEDTDGLASTTNDRILVSNWNFNVGKDQATSSQATLTDGCTIFSALTPGGYLINEELKTGWHYLEPASGSAAAAVIANQQTEINFYNVKNDTFCGDGVKQTPNDALLGGPAGDGLEQCDGTAGLGANQACSSICALVNLPFCGDGACNNSETCSTCSQDCGGCGGGGGGGGGGSSGGSVVLTGLTFNNLSSASNLCSTALVNWSTNQFATSRLLYDTVSHLDLTGQSTPNYGYASSTILDATPVTGHSVALTGLTPGAAYYLRPVSTVASEEKVGDETTILAKANCGEVLGFKIPAPAPRPTSSLTPSPTPKIAGEILGIKILPAAGFDFNELIILILALVLSVASGMVIKIYILDNKEI